VERVERTILLSSGEKVLLDVDLSDQEAAVRWILGRDPDFFSRHIPFIVYVEFPFETGLCGGERIRPFGVRITHGSGGFEGPPSTHRESVPWRFEAKESSKAPC
jgi:hypothetical protein